MKGQPCVAWQGCHLLSYMIWLGVLVSLVLSSSDSASSVGADRPPAQLACSSCFLWLRQAIFLERAQPACLPFSCDRHLHLCSMYSSCFLSVNLSPQLTGVHDTVHFEQWAMATAKNKSWNMVVRSHWKIYELTSKWDRRCHVACLSMQTIVEWSKLELQ